MREPSKKTTNPRAKTAKSTRATRTATSATTAMRRVLKAKSAPTASPARSPDGLRDDVEAALAWLESKSTQRDRDNLVRFGITAKKAYGVSMANLKVLAKRLGRDHELAAALWKSGWYEARMLATLIDEPARVTPAQMERWTKDFDNWGICDTACFHLFDRTPHTWSKIDEWSSHRDEFVKRAAFALLASLALHDKTAPDEPFLARLPLVERASPDERNFVKKGVSWALRAVGERSPKLHAAAVKLAQRLASSDDVAARWIGKDALRALASRAVVHRLARRAAPRRSAK